jgi:hypothetical protein
MKTKKILYSILLYSLLFNACKNKEKKLEDYPIETQLEAKRMTDSIMKEVVNSALFDTVGLWGSPVKVLSARLVKKEYSNYRDISISFKNISQKRIEGIKFKWYGLDAFGETS